MSPWRLTRRQREGVSKVGWVSGPFSGVGWTEGLTEKEGLWAQIWTQWLYVPVRLSNEVVQETFVPSS